MTQTPVASFRSRKIELKIPSSTQYLVWNQIAKQFDEVASLPEDQPFTDDMKSKQRKALNRLSDLMFAIIRHEVDKEWLTDEILEERIVDEDLLELFTSFGDAIHEAADDEEGGDDAPKPAKKSAAKKKSAATRVKS